MVASAGTQGNLGSSVGAASYNIWSGYTGILFKPQSTEQMPHFWAAWLWRLEKRSEKMKLIWENVGNKVKATRLLLILPESLGNKRFIHISQSIKMERNYFLLLSPATTTNDAFLQALFPASRRKLLYGCPLRCWRIYSTFTLNCVLPWFYGLPAQASIILVLFRGWTHLLMCGAFCVHKLLHVGTWINLPL